MPGTVQVSILELSGLPSSKSSSSMTIKVSLGKHTCEAKGANGDFLLPLATLRDNLVVKVHDDEGNEIAHTGVKSRLIAEKGLWDDLFPLEGGGQMHMRLKFSLSEEERNRIRNMRESALKKKQEELLIKNNKDLQAAVAVASSGGRNEMLSTTAISDEVRSFDISLETPSKVVSSKSSSKLPCVIQVKEDDQISKLEKTPSNVKEDDPRYNLKEQSPLPKTPTKVQEDDPRYSLKDQNSLEKAPSKRKKGDHRYNLKEHSPFEKTPSKVREAVAAFEISLPLQGWMATAKEQSNREITDAYPKEETSESISAQNVESLECCTETGPIENRITSYEPKDVDNMEDKSREISDESQPSNSVTEQEYASGVPFLSDIQRDNLLKNPHDRMSNEVSDRRRRCSCRNFHGWIFVEEAMCSCIASDNTMVIDLLGDYSVIPKTYPGKLVGEVTSSKDDKRSGVTKKPEPSHSSGGGASRGPNGQVMKIVIMVGFGLLVLFTRKSKSR